MSKQLRMIQALWSGLPPVTPKVAPGQLERSLAEHTALRLATEAADVYKAAVLVEEHIRSAGERLMASVVSNDCKR